MMKNIKWMPLLMVMTILTIAGFQVYWLSKAYEREERTLELRTNMLFRETVRSVQASKLKLDSLMNDSSASSRMLIRTELGHRGRHGRELKVLPKEKMIGMMDVLMQRTQDPNAPQMVIRTGDSIRVFKNKISPRQNRIMQFLFDVDAIQDSIRIGEIEKAYARRLAEQRLEVPFSIKRIPTPEIDSGRPRFNQVTLGFANPVTYQLNL
ncbi:MAG TPA: hypothetical protein VFL47_10935, partial [Flavisolibacter sp.]|nr:hypothetical protein [Flavisolibacter sp.]